MLHRHRGVLTWSKTQLLYFLACKFATVMLMHVIVDELQAQQTSNYIFSARIVSLDWVGRFCRICFCRFFYRFFLPFILKFRFLPFFLFAVFFLQSHFCRFYLPFIFCCRFFLPFFFEKNGKKWEKRQKNAHCPPPLIKAKIWNPDYNVLNTPAPPM